ncbi:hypothetical protein IFR05_016352 [Cadophora sp. M221]|nr:hypothetical protein IFR05_016352 [Cadophora sp. M221]
MVALDTPKLTDLELAQQGAIDAALRVAQAAAAQASRPVAPLTVPIVTSQLSSTDTSVGRPLATFHPFPRLPQELRTLILKTALPINRLIKITSDDFTFSTMNEVTNEIEHEEILRAKASMWISRLVEVCHDTIRVARASTYITGVRLSYIPLHFSFKKDTLFFEDAAALVSLLGAPGPFEPRDRREEENIIAVFNRNGPKNVVLAGPVTAYEDLTSLIRHFTWVDTLILEEPRRIKGTHLRVVAVREGSIRTNFEQCWKDIRGDDACLPLIRFLPRQNIELMATSWQEHRY